MPLSKPNCLSFKPSLVDEKNFALFKPQFSPQMMKNELSNLSTKSLDLSSNSSIDSESDPNGYHNGFASAAVNECDSIDLRIDTKKNQDKPFSLFNSISKAVDIVDADHRKLVIVENEPVEFDRRSTGESCPGKNFENSPTRSPSVELSALRYYPSHSPGGASSDENFLNLTMAVGNEQSDRLVRRVAPSHHHSVVTIHHGHNFGKSMKDYSIESIISKKEQNAHLEPASHDY